MKKTDFRTDIARGKTGEGIFKCDFLDFLGIEYVDVTNCQKFQVVDTDYKTKIGTYEIKTNYRDDRKIIIEEYTNKNTDLGPISLGWFYKTEADLLIFISKKTRTMVFVPFTDQFRIQYEKIKEKFQLRPNKISQEGNRQWQSAFRMIPLDSMPGFYSMYKRISV